MLKDIFATSMRGHFTTTSADGTQERGQWSYRGYGNAEIELFSQAAVDDRRATVTRITLHSAERQVDQFEIATAWTENTGEHDLQLLAEKEGIYLRLSVDGMEDHPLEGQFELPPETVVDGPSPVFIMHLLLTAMPPEDRSTTTPVVWITPHASELETGFYRVSRTGRHIAIEVLDDDGSFRGAIRVDVADDGCPELIDRDGTLTQIVRTPTSTEAEPGATQ